MKKHKKIVSLILVFLIAYTNIFTACTAETNTPAEEESKTIYIARQFGTAYLPIELMLELEIFEGLLPDDTKVVWRQFANTATIREAMLVGEVDIAFMAIPPFLIGADVGMEWKIFTGLSSIPMGLMVKDETVTSIAELGENARIALPQPGSVQHILLSMAAERELGSHDIFDDQLITMSHPDGVTAMLATSDVSAHFTTAPYLGTEMEAGMRLILSGQEAMGADFTGIVGVARQGFEESKELKIFKLALNTAINMINDEPVEAAAALAKLYPEQNETDILAELTAAGTRFSTEVLGLENFYEFMLDKAYIKKPLNMQSLLLEDEDD